MTEITERQRCCGNCRFYQEYSQGRGWCLRYPPTVYSCDEDNSSTTGSPMMEHNEWCGEFKPKEKHNEHS